LYNEEKHCHFCGEYLDENSNDPKGNRHYLSDCRPDLVEHKIGVLCTWAFRNPPDCYGYYDDKTKTNEHTHFYPDGPMT
jgi:hypothetical protein